MGRWVGGWEGVVSHPQLHLHAQARMQECSFIPEINARRKRRYELSYPRQEQVSKEYNLVGMLSTCDTFSRAKAVSELPVGGSETGRELRCGATSK